MVYDIAVVSLFSLRHFFYVLLMIFEFAMYIFYFKFLLDLIEIFHLFTIYLQVFGGGGVRVQQHHDYQQDQRHKRLEEQEREEEDMQQAKDKLNLRNSLSFRSH